MRLRCIQFLLGLEMLKFFVIDSKSLLLYLVKKILYFQFGEIYGTKNSTHFCIVVGSGSEIRYPVSWMEIVRIRDTGSGINIPDPQLFLGYLSLRTGYFNLAN
jgi:hypothetical protein